KSGIHPPTEMVGCRVNKKHWGGVLGKVSFSCNICGEKNQHKASLQHRESPDCLGCGSTPRFRGLALALCEGLFGVQVYLTDILSHKELRGIGMSDWVGLVALLKQKFSHTDTLFHAAPRYDVMKDDPLIYRDLDYVICSEVFEH